MISCNLIRVTLNQCAQVQEAAAREVKQQFSGEDAELKVV